MYSNVHSSTIYTGSNLGFLGGSAVKNPPATQEPQEMYLGSRSSPGRGHGNLLQYSFLENPMDRAAWRATVQGVAKSDTTEAT